MSFALRMYERFRVLIHEAAKFGVVGLAGFIVSLGGADVLHFDVGMGKYKAVVVATIAATVVTFLGNRYWAFRHRERTGMGRETVLFFVFNGIGLLIQLACVAIVADGRACRASSGTTWPTCSASGWARCSASGPTASGCGGRRSPRPGCRPAATARSRRRRDTRRARWPRRSRPAWTRRPRCTGAGPRSTARGPGTTAGRRDFGSPAGYGRTTTRDLPLRPRDYGPRPRGRRTTARNGNGGRSGGRHAANAARLAAGSDPPAASAGPRGRRTSRSGSVPPPAPRPPAWAGDRDARGVRCGEFFRG